MRRLTELVGGAFVARSRRFQTTSSVVVAGSGAAIVIDPAWDPDELDDLVADLSELGARVVAGVATHFHHDHLLWHPGLGVVPRWASPKTVETALAHRAELLSQLGPDWPPELAELFARIEPVPDAVIEWDGPRIEVIEHDAHAPGHVALWLPSLRLLLAGDMLSDIELPLPAEDDHGLVDYQAGLSALGAVADRAAVLVPGHGSPTSQPSLRVEADWAYLRTVLDGTVSDDPRLSLPGMREADATTRRVMS